MLRVYVWIPRTRRYHFCQAPLVKALYRCLIGPGPFDQRRPPSLASLNFKDKPKNSRIIWKSLKRTNCCSTVWIQTFGRKDRQAFLSFQSRKAFAHFDCKLQPLHNRPSLYWKEKVLAPLRSTFIRIWVRQSDSNLKLKSWSTTHESQVRISECEISMPMTAKWHFN